MSNLDQLTKVISCEGHAKASCIEALPTRDSILLGLGVSWITSGLWQSVAAMVFESAHTHILDYKQ